MRSLQELIQCSDTIYTDAKCEGYFRFAASLILSEKLKGAKSSNGFFSVIKSISDKSRFGRIDENAAHALGINGNNTPRELGQWCSAILFSGGLKTMTLDELDYVMGYAARRCKIKASESKDSDFPGGGYSGRGNGKHRENRIDGPMSSNTPVKQSSKPKTKYRCPKCGEEVDLGETLICRTKTTCPNCHKKTEFNP